MCSRQAKLVAPDSSIGDQFGYSVAIYGNSIVVEARYNDDNLGRWQLGVPIHSVQQKPMTMEAYIEADCAGGRGK